MISRKELQKIQLLAETFEADNDHGVHPCAIVRVTCEDGKSAQALIDDIDDMCKRYKITLLAMKNVNEGMFKAQWECIFLATSTRLAGGYHTAPHMLEVVKNRMAKSLSYSFNEGYVSRIKWSVD